MIRRTFTYATIALTLVSGCSSDVPKSMAQPPAAAASVTQPPAAAASVAQPPAASVTQPPAASVAQPPAAAPSPSVTPSTSNPPAPKPPKLRAGVKGAKVAALQRRLTELGYWNGKADGTFGAVTTQAVYALQKAAGLGRDGVVGPKTRKALDQGVRPSAKSKSGHLVEINLKRQLLMLVDDGKVTQVFNTATGSNQHYEFAGNTHLASTPKGHFTVSRQIDGQRDGPLGPLWRPKYFNGGIAVHGAPSIPPYPASHGCARVSNAAINWIWKHNLIPLKTKVWVY